METARLYGRGLAVIEPQWIPAIASHLIFGTKHQPLIPIHTMNSQPSDIGLIGLAVMGQNLVLNMNDHGYTVCIVLPRLLDE